MLLLVLIIKVNRSIVVPCMLVMLMKDILVLNLAQVNIPLGDLLLSVLRVIKVNRSVVIPWLMMFLSLVHLVQLNAARTILCMSLLSLKLSLRNLVQLNIARPAKLTSLLVSMFMSLVLVQLNAARAILFSSLLLEQRNTPRCVHAECLKKKYGLS